MALVDVLDHFPASHPSRPILINYFKNTCAALLKYQDAQSGCWYQVLDKGSEQGNYLEASASSMFCYAFAKGVRMNYLDESYRVAAQKAYRGILSNFIEEDKEGKPSLHKTVSVGGLGGNPYRDGSYAYYLSEPLRSNDLKGVGPFIMASIEMEIAEEHLLGKGKTVTLDYYFNNEYRKDANGKTERFHYTWDDKTDSGFWLWGNVFQDYGAQINALKTAPTREYLKNTQVYIIVDPDTPKETTNPNYITPEDVTNISEWVKEGGVLVLMANDTANAELKHFNKLTEVFGVQFGNKNLNFVTNNQFEQGLVLVPEKHPIFKDARRLFIKEVCTLLLKKPAIANISQGKDVIMATAPYGKGMVFIVTDPWLYNEYVNGKKLPASFDNFKAMKELSKWLLEQAK